MRARPKGLSIQQLQISKSQMDEIIRVVEYLFAESELISDLLGWEILIFTARARDEFSSSRQNVHIRELEGCSSRILDWKIRRTRELEAGGLQ